MRTRMSLTHDLFGDKLHLYKRENSRHWQCSTYLAGRNHRRTTKKDSLDEAKIVAEDWYLQLRGKARAGELKTGPKFRKVAEDFLREYEALTVGERSPRYVQQYGEKLRKHLLPFFGDKVLTEITPGLVQDYRVHRATSRKHPKTGAPMRPARSTLHHEIVFLRQVLKYANRHGLLAYVPNLSPAYKASGKITHRAWFSPGEYKQLYTATRARVENPLKKRWKSVGEDLHDYVLFMVNTGLRPDEAARLEFRDVEVVEDRATNETILEISVRGKRGTGYCKSMPGAVVPFNRLKKRNNPQPTDRLFPKTHRQLFNTILEEEGLKKDREGLSRTAYSLRHTYICLRLMEGADIYQIAKNCRTSVEMIEKYYAAHIKNMIDAAAVNVRRERPNGRGPKRGAHAKSKKNGRKFGNPKSPR